MDTLQDAITMETLREGDDEEKLQLLQTSDTRSPSAPVLHSKWRGSWHLLFAYTLNLILAVVILYLWIMPRDPLQGVYSPANSAIEYETKVFLPGVGSERSQYQGYPDDNMDKAWDDLYKCKCSSRL